MSSRLLKRYWPLAAVIAVQAAVITLVPSVGPSSAGTGYAASSQGPALQGSAAAGQSAGAGATGTDAAAGGAGTSGSSSSSTSAAGGGGGGSGAAAPASDPWPGGSSTHCVGGREFNPSIAWFAPPCVAGTPGGKYPFNNGGATSPGVTSNQITIVDYISNYGAEVNQILQAEGLLVTYTDAKAWDADMQKFINTHFVLYGRQVKIVTYQGTCQSVPPDYQCLIAEMDRIVATYHPYMVNWVTTLCSACYAELARDHVIAVGGQGFSDAFSNANAPYFYSSGESSTRTEEGFAKWWCSQMSSVNDPSRKVRWANTTNPAQNFNGQPRRLGVVSTNDPDNEATVKNVLEPALARDCGDKVWHTYFYAQTINTASEQVKAGNQALDTPTNPSNSVLCLCDPVAPQFLFGGEKETNYFPENIIATDQGMDFDAVAQSYDGGIACPGSSSGHCPYDNAFGLSTVSAQEPESNDEGLRVWEAGGGSPGSMPLQPYNATAWALDYVMMASLLEASGPDLNPTSTQRGALAMGPIGGGSSGHQLLDFQQNDWQWTQDARVVYWAAGRASPYNGKPGTYVQVEGTRFNMNFPAESDGPPVPAPGTR
jgi:hypothetical protein